MLPRASFEKSIRERVCGPIGMMQLEKIFDPGSSAVNIRHSQSGAVSGRISDDFGTATVSGKGVF